MKSAYRLSILLGLAILVVLGAAVAQDKGPAAKDMKRKDVFGPDKLWTVHLKIGAKEYQDMNPKGGMFSFGGLFPKKDEPKKKDELKSKDEPSPDTHKSKGFGMEFPWVKADIEFEKKLVKEIAVRYTGNSTYNSSASGIKRPFKVDVNHYNDKLKLHGMGGFNLRNNVMDSTRIREALAYSVYSAAKVPASRTAFVKLYLTVPEKHDNVYVGVYTLIEPVDKTFLSAHFKNDNGMLLKPEKIQGLPYMGEKWEAYKDKFNPKREPTEPQKRRLIEFTKLINQADDATFNKEITAYLDVDGFLRYVAASSLTANLDSFVGLGHNYFVYLHPNTNRFHFIPWDLDLSFGGFGFGGDQLEWSIAKPYMGKNRLIERVLAVKENDKAYRGHLRTLTDGAFSPKAMDAVIAQLEATVKDAVAKEPVPPKGMSFGMGFVFGPKKQDLREYAAKRATSVVAQLDGKSEGKVIAGFGFGGPKGGFGMGKQLVKPVFDVADLDKDGKISLDEFKSAGSKLFMEAGGDEKKPVAEKELIDVINRLMPPPQGFGGFKAPPPPKGFGPGKAIATAIMKQGGAGEEKTLSREQFLRGAEKLFGQWDKNKSGRLDEKELTDGINQFIPAPEFGPPPGIGPGPGEPKKGLPAKEFEKEKR